MTRVVQKYGGTSVASATKLQQVAARIRQALRQEHDGVVVVVSAMGDTTERLMRLAHSVNGDPPSREVDMLLSTGETVTAPLLAMALVAGGTPAISLTGHQAGIRTSTSHRRARIIDIVPERVIDALTRGIVPVVAGFQGVTAELDVTTLGRGGSDTTAVALAVAVGADHCEIYTDVRGVFTADPRVVPEARPIPEIAYAEMLEFAAVGARVMHPRAVEIAEAYSMPIQVRSAHDGGRGTVICQHPSMEARQRVRGIAHETDVAKITVLRVPDRRGIAAAIFNPLGERHINADIIVQNVSHDGMTDVSFTVAETDLVEARRVLDDVVREIGADGYDASADIAKVSVVGTGMRHTELVGQMFSTFADAGINIQMISTSEILVTCIIERDRVRDAVRALHRAFELDRI
ncbi:MAG: aspartate kinase [Candidatus Dormibacteria bacterium]